VELKSKEGSFKRTAGSSVESDGRKRSGKEWQSLQLGLPVAQAAVRFQAGTGKSDRGLERTAPVPHKNQINYL